MRNSKTHEELEDWTRTEISFTHPHPCPRREGGISSCVASPEINQSIIQFIIEHLPFIEHLLHHKDRTCGRKMSQSKRSLTFQGINSIVRFCLPGFPAVSNQNTGRSFSVRPIEKIYKKSDQQKITHFDHFEPKSRFFFFSDFHFEKFSDLSRIF